MNNASAALVAIVLLCCGADPARAADDTYQTPVTREQAVAFIQRAEARLREMGVIQNRISWVRATHLTEDTQILAQEMDTRMAAIRLQLAREAGRYRSLPLEPDQMRKLDLLQWGVRLPPPDDPVASAELFSLVDEMTRVYSTGRFCPDWSEDCMELQGMQSELAASRDPARLQSVWDGWHDLFPRLGPTYQRYRELANQGAEGLGFEDLGALWRAGFEMEPGQVRAEAQRLWEQLLPLYQALHAYVRQRLREVYGEQLVPAAGPIPAHLLGNMWAQRWTALYPLLVTPEMGAGVDLTERLVERGLDAGSMVLLGERFYTSMGFQPLPESFWDRSMLERPKGRDVVCHASAWHIDLNDDLRIKMCVDITAGDFATIHHELGHNYYQWQYREQPVLFQGAANEAFHEAVADIATLSITPDYLRALGLLENEDEEASDLGMLLRMALDKVAFLPYGMIVDLWRWGVFAGDIAPEDYNDAWWQLKRRYQGVSPPEPREPGKFDPVAKYHVAASIPYMRYFFARVLQFQFHRALCRQIGFQGPMHRCSLYGDTEAGERIRAMMSMGRSRPWPDALEELTGERSMDATALLEYFQPLRAWLELRIQGQPVGWDP